MEVIEVPPNGVIEIPLYKLGAQNRLGLDPRVIGRGFLAVSLQGDRIVLRATRFVGLIPLRPDFAVRVVPPYGFENLARMLLRSGVPLRAVSDLPEDTTPLLASPEAALRLYYQMFLIAVEQATRQGVMKDYAAVAAPLKWRGRLMIADTVRRFRAKGIRHDAAFDHRTLSPDIPENRILRAALDVLRRWLPSSTKETPNDWLGRTSKALAAFEGVNELGMPSTELFRDMSVMVERLPPQHDAYARALWGAYAILRSRVPTPGKAGEVSLDTLVIDAATIFEAFIRQVLRDRLSGAGVVVEDGNRPGSTLRFFVLGDLALRVEPDVILRRGNALALLDAKHKPFPTSEDRYELLAGMEASGAVDGGFVCPCYAGNGPSSRWGTTAGGRTISTLRFDVATADLEAEEARFASEAAALLAGVHPP